MSVYAIKHHVPGNLVFAFCLVLVIGLILRVAGFKGNLQLSRRPYLLHRFSSDLHELSKLL